jgi:hypothetical protein
MMFNVDRDIDRDERLRKYVPYIGWTMTVTLVAEALLGTLVPRNWQPVPIALGIAALTVAGGLIGQRGHRRRRRPRGVGLAVCGADGDATPAAAPASPSRLMTAASWLMPPAAGQRWLAEADSLLAEIAPDRRAQAMRSYLWSAPALAATLWTRAALRRTRTSRRRPG